MVYILNIIFVSIVVPLTLLLERQLSRGFIFLLFLLNIGMMLAFRPLRPEIAGQ